MKCPICHKRLRVYCTQPITSTSTWRYLKCDDCDKTYKSIERMVKNRDKKRKG